MEGIIGTLAGTILGAMIAFIGSRLGFIHVSVYRISFGPVVSKPGDIPQMLCKLDEADEIKVHFEILYSSTRNIPTTVFDPIFEISTEKGISERFPLAQLEKHQTNIGSLPFLGPVRALPLGVRETKHIFFEIIINQKDIVDAIKLSPNTIKAYIGHRSDSFWLPLKFRWIKKRIRQYVLCEKQSQGNAIPKETEIRI